MKKVILLFVLLCSCIDSNENSLKGDDFELFKGTPVYELAKAIKNQDISRISKLVKKGNNIDYIEPKFGQTLLILAIKNNLKISVEHILKNNADIDVYDSYDGTSAIIEASKIGENYNTDSSILKLLLDYGANPNDIEKGERRKDNYTRNNPLILASKCCFEKVKLLVESGANINFVNEYNQSALYSALNGYKGKEKVVKYLLDNGADYNLVFKTTTDGKEIKILDKLRQWTFEIDSDAHKIKMEIVDSLQKKGIDYRKSKIPEKYLGKYSKEYLEKY